MLLALILAVYVNEHSTMNDYDSVALTIVKVSELKPPSICGGAVAMDL